MSDRMTVGELIAELETFDENDIVMFTWPSGNHTQDEMATSPDMVEHGNVRWSEYCRSHVVMTEDYEEKWEPDDEEEGIKRDVCLIQ
jgi:hypothetical protein